MRGGAGVGEVPQGNVGSWAPSSVRVILSNEAIRRLSPLSREDGKLREAEGGQNY
jgi:hypothetical protein